MRLVVSVLVSEWSRHGSAGHSFANTTQAYASVCVAAWLPLLFLPSQCPSPPYVIAASVTRDAGLELSNFQIFIKLESLDQR